MPPEPCVDRVALQLVPGPDSVDHVLSPGLEVERAPVPVSTVVADPVDDVMITIDTRVRSTSDCYVGISDGFGIAPAYPGADGKIWNHCWSVYLDAIYVPEGHLTFIVLIGIHNEHQ